MTQKLFGTDGIRGVANTFPLTIDFCTKLATTLAQDVCLNKKQVAIARDTRISGTMLFSALVAGFTAQGINVIDLGIIPTPLCTTLTPQLNVDMSIMITASHNPYQDNGLKLITADGDKFSDEQSRKIEQKLELNHDITYSPEKIGKIIPWNNNGLEHYLHISSQIVPPNALKKLKIVLDSANGVFSYIMPEVFKYLGAEVISLAASPDGYNINADCGSQHTEKLAQTVIENGYNLGIAVDGDGDRIIICDENGKRLDGDQIIAYLATYMLQNNLLPSKAVVATIYSNLGLGKYISSLGLNYYTTAVGERYVIEKMRDVQANLGGEESGHMVLSDYTRTGDALITALIICAGIARQNRQLSKIFPVFTPFPCESHNLRFDSKEAATQIMQSEALQSCVSQISQQLDGHGRIIVRPSGTEPVIRLKIEDENSQTAHQAAEKILTCIKNLTAS